MDRLLLLCVALSTGLHSVVIARLSPLTSREIGQPFRAPIEFSYIGTAGGSAGGRLISGPAGAGEGPSVAAVEEAGTAQVSADPQALRGTGEMLSGITQETLKPLTQQEEGDRSAYSEAVRRYRKQIEQVLEQESKLSYPHIAMESRREARLQVRFCVRRDGVLESIEVPPRCGDFDRELIAGLKKAAVRFPAFPGEIKCEKLTFCWPVSFDLR